MVIKKRKHPNNQSYGRCVTYVNQARASQVKSGQQYRVKYAACEVTDL